MTLLIITGHPDIVIEEIQNTTHHGVTRFEGQGTYYGKDVTMLYTVIENSGAKALINRIREIDPTSFVNVTKTEYLEGAFLSETYRIKRSLVKGFFVFETLDCVYKNMIYLKKQEVWEEIV